MLLLLTLLFFWPTSTKPVGTKTLRKWNNGLQRASWLRTCFEMRPHYPSVVPQTIIIIITFIANFPILHNYCITTSTTPKVNVPVLWYFLLIYIYLGRSAVTCTQEACSHNVGRRMVVARQSCSPRELNCSRIKFKLKSNWMAPERTK